MISPSFSMVLVWIIAGMFAANGLLHAAGPGFMQRALERRGFPPEFHRATAVVQLLTAAFLAEPTTRLCGVILAAMVTFVAIVALLQNRQYAWSFPGILLLIALVPASASAFI